MYDDQLADYYDEHYYEVAQLSEQQQLKQDDNKERLKDMQYCNPQFFNNPWR